MLGALGYRVSALHVDHGLRGPESDGDARFCREILGAEVVFLDRGDYPLEMNGAAIDELTDVMRDVAPDVILGHARQDPFNPDHGVSSEATIRGPLPAIARERPRVRSFPSSVDS